MAKTDKPTILSCAVTGSFGTREQNPTLPVTPEEIANDSIAAAKAGAAICHIHVRDPETSRPSIRCRLHRQPDDGTRWTLHAKRR